MWAALVRFIVSNEERTIRRRRLVLGIVVLLLVDVIWVGSAELMEYIFKDEEFDKPFFLTYFNTSSFMIYLTGFLFLKPWRHQCTGCRKKNRSSDITVSVNQTGESSSLLNSPEPPSLIETSPVRRPLMNESSIVEVTNDEITSGGPVEVRSSSYEIIPSTDHVAEQAGLAKLPHKNGDMQKLPIWQVAKVALIFCFLWFAANYSYAVGIAYTSPAAVNILSSSSGLFTLILASVFQSSAADKFSISKLLAVLVSITGIVLVTLSDSKSKASGLSVGALWSLASALLYACYLTMLKHKVPDEKQMDITMFFGLVGAFNFLLLWPGFLFLHYVKLEVFELPPSGEVWGFLVLNAVVGTVLSDFLWLWGCYLTSSLTATLSLVLIIPMTMVADVILKRVHFSWMFLVGTITAFASFFAVTVLTQYGDWDPVLSGLKKLVNSRRHLIERSVDTEQREALFKDVPEERNEVESREDEIET